MTIKSKFDPINAIIAPIILEIVLGGIGVGLGYISFLDVSNGKVDSIFKTLIYGSVLMFGAMIGLVIHYLKTIKKIQIDNQGIKFTSLFSSEFIRWNEVEKIELTGKSRNRSIFAETTNLDLKSGKGIDIIAAYYQNMPNLRMTLRQVHQFLTNNETVQLKQNADTRTLETVKHLNTSGMNNYSGNHFLSFNGIMIYVWTAVSIYFFSTLDSTQYLGSLLLVFLVMFGFFYSFLGFQLHYFYLDKNYLVVKNHVWPWVNHAYKIEDIKEVVFELPYRRSNSLRVITKGYQSKLYPAGSLRDKTWKAFKEEFMGLKVNIRDEINM
ncbi:MAG: hypothetical protein PSV36_05965 [Algoriphagus sp.]|nr:hypothetical protein [Algoriphagus sp.]